MIKRSGGKSQLQSRGMKTISNLKMIKIKGKQREDDDQQVKEDQGKLNRLLRRGKITVNRLKITKQKGI